MEKNICNFEKQDSNNSLGDKQQPKTFLEKIKLKNEYSKEMLEIRKKNLEEGKEYDFSKLNF
jgi:hypothetical protein